MSSISPNHPHPTPVSVFFVNFYIFLFAVVYIVPEKGNNVSNISFSSYPLSLSLFKVSPAVLFQHFPFLEKSAKVSTCDIYLSALNRAQFPIQTGVQFLKHLRNFANLSRRRKSNKNVERFPKSTSGSFLPLSAFDTIHFPEQILWVPVKKEIIPSQIFSWDDTDNLLSCSYAKNIPEQTQTENAEEKLPHNFHCRLIPESGSRGC